MTDHYEGKSALSHVATRKAEGILSFAETHGTEIPGHFHAFADALRGSSLLFLLHWLLLRGSNESGPRMWSLLAIFFCGWLFWNVGRSTWLGFSRLERMHRIVEQERSEIKNHRSQEREELSELYRAKGLDGKLLEDVIDVFMADDERLLQIMVDEELCLSLGTHVHPLQQGVGAGLGVCVAGALAWICCFFLPETGIYISTILGVGGGALISAVYEKNQVIPAIVWSIGIGAVSSGMVYFLLQVLHAY
ncbi:MAG: VIT1/CCC1 transporter family protein [Waddliaceae bacterium]